MSDTPKVWVGCLGCYNAAFLIGAWFDAVDAPTEVEEFDKKVDLGRARASHREYGHDELWVMDHGGFHGLLGSEFSPTDGARVAAVIEELGDLAGAYAAWRSAGKSSGTLGDSEDVAEFRDDYMGTWDSELAYAETYLDESNILDKIPEDLRQYFDTSAYARHLFMDGYSSVNAPGNEVYVFYDR
jgi:antirestriction protein